MQIIPLAVARKQGLIHYFTGKPCKHDHISKRYTKDKKCFQCSQEKNVRLQSENPELFRRAAAKHRKKYPEKTKQVTAEWIKTQKELGTYSALRSKYRRRYQNNPNVRLARKLRNRVHLLLRGFRKCASAVADLGCSIHQAKTHIENQFRDGMNWENWGSIWELDHKQPLMNFDLSVKQQALIVLNYKNLQPLLIQEHKIKSANELRERANLRERAKYGV